MAIRNRRAIPAEIADAPQVSDNNILAWLCFWDLRRGSDNQQALRWADVLLWADTYGCSLQQMEGLQASVVVLDSVYLPIMRAKAKAAQKAANGGGR